MSQIGSRIRVDALTLRSSHKGKSLLGESFRVDGSAAVIAASGSVRTELTLIEVATGRSAAVSISGFLEGAALLR